MLEEIPNCTTQAVCAIRVILLYFIHFFLFEHFCLSIFVLGGNETHFVYLFSHAIQPRHSRGAALVQYINLPIAFAIRLATKPSSILLFYTLLIKPLRGIKCSSARSLPSQIITGATCIYHRPVGLQHYQPYCFTLPM